MLKTVRSRQSIASTRPIGIEVEDVGDELRNADEAERRVIDEVRQLGAELLGDWAEGQMEKRKQELEQTTGVWREGK